MSYYLISVLGLLHWLALVGFLVALTAMTCSKLAAVATPADSATFNFDESKTFRKLCQRYTLILAVITVFTPPIEDWVKAKTDVEALRRECPGKCAP